MLNVNDPAPDFTLKNTEKQDVSLSQFSEKTVVLAFYPGAFKVSVTLKCAHSKII